MSAAKTSLAIDTARECIQKTSFSKQDTLASTTTITITKTIDSSDNLATQIIASNPNFGFVVVAIVTVLIFRKNIKSLIDAIGTRIVSSETVDVKLPGGISIVAGRFVPEQTPEGNLKGAGQQQPQTQQIPENFKHILSTLWKHQNEHDNTYATRWSFSLGSANPEYLNFINSANQLCNTGLISLNRLSNQYFLTEAGIEYCKANKGSIGEFSYFGKA